MTTTTSSANPAWAKGLTCKDLRGVCRAMKITSYNRMTKSEMITVCDLRRKVLQEQNIDPDTSTPEEQKAAILKLSKKCTNKTNPSEDEVIECMARTRLEKGRAASKAVYAAQKLDCDSKKGELLPDWDYGSANDCPKGYYRNAKGCCVPIRMHLDVMTADELQQVCKGCNKDIMTKEELKHMLKDHMDAEAELDAYVGQMKFGSRAETEMVARLAADIQKQFKSLFSSELNALRDFGSVGQDCDALGASTATSGDSKSKDVKTSKIWTFMSWTSRKVLAGGSKLTQYGFQLGAWIARNPRTARIVTFMAIQMKNKVCYRMGQFFKGHKQETAEALQHFVEDSSALAAESITVGFQQVFQSTSKDAVKKLTKQAGTFLGGAIKGFVPGGWFIGSAFDLIVDAASDSMGKATEFSIEVTFFQENSIEALANIVKFLDLESCSSEVLGKNHALTLAFQKVKLALSKIPHSSVVIETKDKAVSVDDS